MKKINYLSIILLLIVPILVSSFSSSAKPTTVLIDQGIVDWTNSGHIGINSGWIGQSFKPGQNNIFNVELFLSSDTVETVTMYITNTYSGNEPTGNAIVGQTSGTTVADGSGQWIDFDFSSSPLTTTVGVTYYIVIQATGGTVTWELADDLYADGEATCDPAKDCWFKTYYDDAYPLIVIDQGDVTWANSGHIGISSGWIGQSFKQGQNNIAKVELSLSCTTAESVTLYITNTYTGIEPTGDEIVGQTIGTTVAGGAWHWIEFDFSSSPLITTVGATYYIVIQATGGTVTWQLANNPYADGQATCDPAKDCWFKTYYNRTTVPEGSISTLFLLGFSCLTIIILVKKKKVNR